VQDTCSSNRFDSRSHEGRARRCELILDLLRVAGLSVVAVADDCSHGVHLPRAVVLISGPSAIAALAHGDAAADAAHDQVACVLKLPLIVH